MNFQIYKLTNDKWNKIEIEKVKKDDIIKVFDLTKGGYLLNSNKTIISICVKGAYMNDNGWNIDSNPYEIKKL